MKAVRVKDAAQVRGLRVFHTDYHLLDAYAPRTPGGTGETFNWELARLHEGPAEVVPLGRPRPRQRGRGDRGGAPVRGRHGERHRGVAGPQGPGARARVLQGGRGGARAGMSSPPIERRFGPYGGRYVPETLIPALDELERAWLDARADPGRRGALLAAARLRGPSDAALSGARRLSEAAGSEVWLKREDLLHTGAHKINNALGQALLARRMDKRA